MWIERRKEVWIDEKELNSYLWGGLHSQDPLIPHKSLILYVSFPPFHSYIYWIFPHIPIFYPPFDRTVLNMLLNSLSHFHQNIFTR